MLEPTCILLAVRPRLFCEALGEGLRQRLGRRAHVVTLEDWRDEIDLLVATREHEASVVVLTVGLEERVPSAVSRLLQEFPGLWVLALDWRTERARTYRVRIEVRAVEELTVVGLVLALRRLLPDEGTGAGN